MDTGGIILEDVQAEQAHIQPQTHTHFVCRLVSGCNELHSKKCWVVITKFWVKYGEKNYKLHFFHFISFFDRKKWVKTTQHFLECNSLQPETNLQTKCVCVWG